jgi:hypothetical protein
MDEQTRRIGEAREKSTKKFKQTAKVIREEAKLTAIANDRRKEFDAAQKRRETALVHDLTTARTEAQRTKLRARIELNKSFGETKFNKWVETQTARLDKMREKMKKMSAEADDATSAALSRS